MKEGKKKDKEEKVGPVLVRVSMHAKIHNKEKKAKLSTEKEERRNVPTEIPFRPKKLPR